MALTPGQRKCIQTLDKPLVVAAGAGSGKTFTLTERIVHALQVGYISDIGQVCAITFTNKAAAELKSRVKAELRARGMAEQSLKADDAWISTIHGMCARILRAHALELDLDPGFKMGDELKLGRLRAESLDAVLRQAEGLAGVDVSDGQPPAAPPMRGDADDVPASEDALARFDLSAADVSALFGEYPARAAGRFGDSTVEGMLEELMRLAAANPRGFDAFAEPCGGDGMAPVTQLAVDAYDRLVSQAGEQKASATRDAWLGQAREALVQAREALAAGGVRDDLDALRLLARLEVRKNFGSREFKALASSCAAERDACIMRLRLAAASPHLHALLGLARAALALFQRRKRREGVLDNDDLIVLASRALAGHPDIAAEYANKFQLVMVDEFQDTDQMQVEMIRRIAGPGAQRLCTVGDGQQSIYRFRGADVGVYRRHLQGVRAADPDAVIELSDNFRSHADVLAFVDRVFAQPQMFGGEFMRLAPGRDESQVRRPFAEGRPRVLVQHVTRAWSGGATAAEVTCERARQVAEAFSQFREEGHPAGDMAVLLGRMANAGAYARALRDAGFACVVSGGSVFRETPEAQAVLDLARAAVNAADTEALYNVLSGPLFRVPDDDLLALATAVNPRDGLPARRALDAGLAAFAQAVRREGAPCEGGPSAQLRNAMQVLGELWRAVGRTALSRALMQAIVDSGWVSRLEAHGPEGLASAANAYKAIRMVEDIEAEETLGPVGTLFALEEMLQAVKEAPGALSTEGGDFVRIMTVHASKGLEFPIVAVSEFGEGASGSRALQALDVGDRILLSLDLGSSRKRIGGAVSAVRPVDTVFPPLLGECDDEDGLKELASQTDDALVRRAALDAYEQVGDEEESKRLLYVALTRAKEALVVSMAGRRTKGNPNGLPGNCLALLATALAGDEEGFQPGVSLLDFGGSAPAVVRHVVLDDAAEEPGEAESPEDVIGQDGAAGERAAVERFMVPASEKRPYVLRVPYADAHEGIFSYSSIAEASHAGDLLGQLAARFAVSCDAAMPEAPGLSPDRPDESGFLRKRQHDDRLAAMADEDDGSWAYLGSDCHDADKATDFGTAFHRLAQYAVVHRRPDGPLVAPPASRVRTMMRACGLDGRQWSRLDDALERWFGSDEAQAMAAWADLRAEVPFFIALDVPREAPDLPTAGHAAPSASTAYLEGEIDLLALSEDGASARVVDYKTGGRADEADADLRHKHVLQASCYALALLRQGVRQVEASFVRVERPRAEAPVQPQCVRYAFCADDAPVLEQAIVRAYLLA